MDMHIHMYISERHISEAFIFKYADMLVLIVHSLFL